MAKNSESIEETQRIEGLRKLASLGKDKSKGNGSLSVNIDIDVSDALKGLKAVQREAKRTASALREVENLSDKRLIESLTDEEIITVLTSRGWDGEVDTFKDEDGSLIQSAVKLFKKYK